MYFAKLAFFALSFSSKQSQHVIICQIITIINIYIYRVVFGFIPQVLPIKLLILVHREILALSMTLSVLIYDLVQEFNFFLVLDFFSK